MGILDVVRRVNKVFKKNSKTVFLIGNLAGGVVTTVLAFEAGYKSRETVQEMRAKAGDKADDIPKMDYVKACAKHVIPTGLSLAVQTSSGIAYASTMSKENAALAAIASASELAKNNVIEAVKENLGKEKAGDVEEAAAEKTLERRPVSNREVVTTGYGMDLCYDEYTDRYFYCSADHLRKVMNDMNARILREMYVTFNEVYSEIGLKRVAFGDSVCWNVDHQIDFRITTALTDNDQPCLVLGHYQKPVTINDNSEEV